MQRMLSDVLTKTNNEQTAKSGCSNGIYRYLVENSVVGSVRQVLADRYNSCRLKRKQS